MTCDPRRAEKAYHRRRRRRRCCMEKRDLAVVDRDRRPVSTVTRKYTVP